MPVSVCVKMFLLISGHAACHKSWVLNYSRKLDSTQADTATCHAVLGADEEAEERQRLPLPQWQRQR